MTKPRRLDDRHVLSAPRDYLANPGDWPNAQPRWKRVPGAGRGERVRVELQQRAARLISAPKYRDARGRIALNADTSPHMLSMILKGERWAPAVVMALIHDELGGATWPADSGGR